MFELKWLGTLDYEAALKVQEQTAEGLRQTAGAIVLACEHPTVITLGKRGQALDDILISLEVLRKEGVRIFATDRGGQATLHNPGQLVLYPILPLKKWHLGVRQYVECLERATACLLAEHGLDVTRGYEPGLFVNGKKIAAFGIRVDRGVSLHGVAINIYNKLEPFSWIRQCGMTVEASNLLAEMAAFSRQEPHLSLPGLAQRWAEIFLEELENLKLEPKTPPAFSVDPSTDPSTDLSV